MENVKNRYLFESMPVPKAVAKMAIPTVFGQLVILAYNIADTLFIGTTNDRMMVAAVSLILPVFNICLSLASLAGVGGSALLSRLLGVGRDDEAKKVFGFSVRLSLGVAALFSLMTFLFMDPLLRLLGANDDTIGFARTYATLVIVAGGIPTIMTNVLANFVRSVGESVKAGFGVIMGGLINIALDPLFMFVILPSGNEVAGAGIATFLSNVISCLYFVLVIAKLGNGSVLKMGSLRDMPDKKSVGLIFSVGIPSAVDTFLFDLDYIVIDKLMSGYAEGAALAAMGIVLKAERLPLNIGVGICQGMVPIVAYNYASGNNKRRRSVELFALTSGIVCAVLSIVMYEFLSPNIMRLFIKDSATVALGTDFLRIRCLATIFMFMSFYHVHLFNSYGKGGYALLLGVIRWGALNIPMQFILHGIFGMYGIVWAQITSDVINVTVSFIIHRRYMKTHGLAVNKNDNNVNDYGNDNENGGKTVEA